MKEEKYTQSLLEWFILRNEKVTIVAICMQISMVLFSLRLLESALQHL